MNDTHPEGSSAGYSIAVARERYATKWCHGDATHFASNGWYDWMAAFLKGYNRVLEIGTGDGSGTIALCRGGSVAVSVEKNPSCLDLAAAKIQAAGIPLQVEPRGPSGTEEYSSDYGEVASTMPLEGALIVGSDVMVDAGLMRWLKSNGPLDGIACWNIGFHGSPSDDSESEHRFREQMEKFAFALGHHFLRVGGILHFIVRARAPTPELQESMVYSLGEYFDKVAEGTGLEIQPEVHHHPYELTPGGSGINMTLESFGNYAFAPGQFAFWSLTAKKL